MKLNKLLASAIFVAGVSVGAGQAGATTVFDFANSNVPAGGFYYSAGEAASYSDGNVVSMTDVTFAGMSGIQLDGSRWGFTPAPDGASAFIQSYSGAPGAPGVITFALPAGLTGTQKVTFSDSDRPGKGYETFTVSYDGELLDTYTPETGWTTQTLTFVANGSGDGLVFTGSALATAQNGGDFDAGIAHVTVTAVPEASTWLMMLAGFVGLGFVGARRKAGSTFA